MERGWKHWKAVGVTLVLVCCLAGCLGRETEPTGMPGKTFGVYNAFPEHPIYLKKKTLAMSQQSREIETLSLRAELTAAMVRFVKSKGYQAVAVADPSALDRGEVDMLIRILPVQVHKIQGMIGYGFSDRELLWGLMNRPASSFVAMQLILQRKNSSRIVKTDREERFSRLEDLDMPETWESLSPAEQNAFEANLRENMVKAAYLSLSRLKI